MAKETSSIGRSLGTLCVTLCFIYVIFFGVRGDAIQQEVAYIAQSQYATANIAQANNSITPTLAPEEPVSVPTLTAVESEPNMVKVVAPDAIPGRRFYSTQELFRPEEAPQIEVTYGKILLADTWEREGNLKSLVAAGLQGRQEYILKNLDNTHFIRFANFRIDHEPYLRAAVAAAGGNIVEITDENLIQQLQLFGEEIRYINLPQFTGIKQLLLVFFNQGKDVRYIQVDHEIYPDRQTSLASTFAPRYDW